MEFIKENFWSLLSTLILIFFLIYRFFSRRRRKKEKIEEQSSTYSSILYRYIKPFYEETQEKRVPNNIVHLERDMYEANVEFGRLLSFAKDYLSLGKHDKDKYKDIKWLYGYLESFLMVDYNHENEYLSRWKMIVNTPEEVKKKISYIYDHFFNKN